MRTITSTVFVFVLLLCLATTGAADTRYISDQLVVTVRSNKSKNYKSLDNLLTATPVQVLSEDANFVKVRTNKGIEGYIRRQYVTKKIPKAMQIATLKKEKAVLEAKLEKQQSEFQNANNLATSSQSTIKQLTAELEQTQQQLNLVSKKYAELQEQSANIINMTTERDQLLEENSQINSELKVLQEENAGFHRTNMIQWFLAGGGVFFGGWLAGKVSRKKQRYSRF